MPFDPDYPQGGVPMDPAAMRAQLNALKALIDAILTITGAQVDAVNTVNPGDPADASVSVTGNVLHFVFNLPRGNDGIVGPPGNDGGQGPPFAQAIIDAVNTLNPGDPASVSVSFDGTNVHFTFSIPRGNDGVPGEVSSAQLASAIDGTSANTNNIATLDTPFTDDPLSLANGELLRAKLNELILNGRR